MARYNSQTGQLMCGSFNCDKQSNLHTDPETGISYCWDHFSEPETREFSEDPRRRIYNRKKERLCDAFGCVQKNLIFLRGGLYCARHRADIQVLRRQIDPHMNTPDEIYARLVEVHFRKRYDISHWNYLVDWVTRTPREELVQIIKNMAHNAVFKSLPEYYEPAVMTIYHILQNYSS